jgi:hypothetical protein
MVSTLFQNESSQNTTGRMVRQTWTSQQHLPQKYYNAAFKIRPKNQINKNIGAMIEKLHLNI